MISLRRVGLAALLAAGVCLGATTAPATKKAPVSTKSKKKRYRSSIGKPAAKTAAAKKAPLKTAAKKVGTTASTVHRRVTTPRALRVSAASRLEANQGVFQKVS